MVGRRLTLGEPCESVSIMLKARIESDRATGRRGVSKRSNVGYSTVLRLRLLYFACRRHGVQTNLPVRGCHNLYTNKISTIRMVQSPRLPSQAMYHLRTELERLVIQCGALPTFPAVQIGQLCHLMG